MIIPRESSFDVQRWQAESFDAPIAETLHEEKPVDGTGFPLVLPTAEDIDRMHEEAQQSGYKTGFTEGRAAGFSEGKAAGFTEGYENGFTEGREAGFAEGKEKGYTEGDALGRVAGDEKAHAEAEKMVAILAQLESAFATFEEEMASDLLRLGIEIARQITRATIQSQPDVLLPLIREALAALPLNHGNMTLRLHPDDGKNIRAHLGEYLVQMGARIVDDEEVSPGGCLLRAGGCEIDASIETRWQRVLESLGRVDQWSGQVG